MREIFQTTERLICYFPQLTALSYKLDRVFFYVTQYRRRHSYIYEYSLLLIHAHTLYPYVLKISSITERIIS
jgi:hypothetical protein